MRVRVLFLRYTEGMRNSYGWYENLIRPEWAPPSWLFGPVWSVLYTIIAISFGYVGWLRYQGKIGWLVALPFVLNLAFNAAFTPVQFGLQNLPLASLVILLVLGTLVWAMVQIYPIAPWVMWVNIPYLLWVSFATVLQITITLQN